MDEYKKDGFQPLFGFDVTGNQGLIPLFAVAEIDAVDITFSGPRKWAMYQRMQYYLQKRLIKRAMERDMNMLRECDFNYQMGKIEVKSGTNTRYGQIHHESEDDLDDCCDTLAGLIHLIEDPSMPSLAFALIDNKGQSILDKEGKIIPDEDKVDKEETESEDEEFKGQYIPPWMDREELKKSIEQRDRAYR